MQNIKIIFDRFVEDSAIFITESGKQILWPKDKLPEDLQPGQTSYLTITNNPNQNQDNKKQKTKKQEPEKDQKKLAKAILHEILNSSEQENLDK